MRILVFSPFYPPHTGGLESHSDEFNKHLSALGASILVFTPRLPDTAPTNERRYPGVLVWRFPAFELFHNYPLPRFWNREFWDAWRKLKRFKADIVLSRTRFFFTSLMAWRFARYRGTPWVHVEHGSDFAHFNGAFKTWLGELYDKSVGRWVLRNADQVIANSKASAAFVCALAKHDACHVIYRGVEKEAILKAPGALSDQTVPCIGYIGRLIDGKGVDNLLKALSPIKQPYIALIVGSGPEEPHLRLRAQEMGIADRVRFLGQRSFTEAMGLLKSFDIFVNPSLTEGIPTAVIEAALCRKAIVATDVGGTGEIISHGDSGYLVPPQDITALTERLTELLENPKQRQMFGERAFQSVQNKFDWTTAAQEYLKLFTALQTS